MTKVRSGISESSAGDAIGADAPSALHDRVSQVLDLIRPAVQMDGGDLELVEVTEAGIVSVRLHGACVGCPSSQLTLHAGIERHLKERIPEITAVQAVS